MEGTSQDERKEEAETSQVHVALRIEFSRRKSRLDSRITRVVDFRQVDFRRRAQHPLDRVDEENADKDEGNLERISDFGYNSRPGKEGEEFPANTIWEGCHQETEYDHFCSQKLKREVVVDCHGGVRKEGQRVEAQLGLLKYVTSMCDRGYDIHRRSSISQPTRPPRPHPLNDRNPHRQLDHPQKISDPSA